MATKHICDYCGEDTERLYKPTIGIGSVDGPPKALTGRADGDHMPGFRHHVPGMDACAKCYELLENQALMFAQTLLECSSLRAGVPTISILLTCPLCARNRMIDLGRVPVEQTEKLPALWEVGEANPPTGDAKDGDWYVRCMNCGHKGGYASTPAAAVEAFHTSLPRPDAEEWVPVDDSRPTSTIMGLRPDTIIIDDMHPHVQHTKGSQIMATLEFPLKTVIIEDKPGWVRIVDDNDQHVCDCPGVEMAQIAFYALTSIHLADRQARVVYLYQTAVGEPDVMPTPVQP